MFEPAFITVMSMFPELVPTGKEEVFVVTDKVLRSEILAFVKKKSSIETPL